MIKISWNKYEVKYTKPNKIKLLLLLIDNLNIDNYY